MFFLALWGNAQQAFEPKASIKNNLLYDLTLTPNIGGEAEIGRQSTLQVFYGLNAWNYSAEKRLKHWSVMPEYRYWARRPFEGHFFGLHAFGGQYSIAGVGLFKTIRANRYEGWYAGAGLTYGYAWQLSERWRLEGAIGVGYTHVKFDKYVNEACGQQLDNGHRHFAGPTKLALNIGYLIGKRRPMPAPDVAEALVVLPYHPHYRFSFVTPQAEAEKTRELRGRAYLDFMVNKTDIRPDYRRNAVELAKVQQTIDAVRLDPNTTITHISIHGYASPEGDYRHNGRLAQGRAQAFKDYVQMLMVLPADIFSVRWTPEDWDGLVEKLNEGVIGQADVLTLIRDTSLAPDEKERRLKRQYGHAWQLLLDSIFPSLRHSDYEVSYTIRPFTVDEARVLIKHKPQQLSLNEMFLVAQTYEPGSREYNDVFLTAVRMYPEDETANLNAAIIALLSGDTDEAARRLEKAGVGDEAWNARGVMRAMRGDVAGAAEAWAKSMLPEARHNEAELRKLLYY
jgi:hypothetical protein